MNPSKGSLLVTWWDEYGPYWLWRGAQASGVEGTRRILDALVLAGLAEYDSSLPGMRAYRVVER